VRHTICAVNHCTFALQNASISECPSCQNCVAQFVRSITTLFLCRHVKIALPKFVRSITTLFLSKHVKIALPNLCGQSLHFSYPNMSKLRPHHRCPLYQPLHICYAKLPNMRPPNTTLFLVKRPPYRNTTHSHASMSKLRPCMTVHYINHHTLLHKHPTTVHQFSTTLSSPKQAKNAAITQHINSYTFPVLKQAKNASTKQTTALLLCKQVSTISTRHLSCLNKQKLRPITS
jgi:hypothetical protein